MVEYEHTPVSVRDKRAVVVGGTSGIGQAIALGFAHEGADVIATSRDAEKVDETATAIEETGTETVRVTCDVRDRETLDAVCEAAVEVLGGIDVVVASQGAISRESVLEISDDDWDFVTDVALDGVRRVTQAFAPAMADVGEDGTGENAGAIVNISSLSARLAMADLPAYAASKGGVEAFTRAAAKELAPAVRVNAIAPGFVITPQNADTYAPGTEKRQRIEERAPVGRVADRDEMVGAAVFLASDAASYVTGEVLTVDGGFADSAL